MRFLNLYGNKPLTADQQVIFSAIINDPRLKEKDYLVILWQDDDQGYSGVEVAKVGRKYSLSVSLFFVENKLYLMRKRWEKAVYIYHDPHDDVPLSRVADTIIQILQ